VPGRKGQVCAAPARPGPLLDRGVTDRPAPAEASRAQKPAVHPCRASVPHAVRADARRGGVPCHTAACSCYGRRRRYRATGIGKLFFRCVGALAAPLAARLPEFVNSGLHFFGASVGRSEAARRGRGAVAWHSSARLVIGSARPMASRRGKSDVEDDSAATSQGTAQLQRGARSAQNMARADIAARVGAAQLSAARSVAET
jgi:hypothetical protein